MTYKKVLLALRHKAFSKKEKRREELILLRNFLGGLANYKIMELFRAIKVETFEKEHRYSVEKKEKLIYQVSMRGFEKKLDKYKKRVMQVTTLLSFCYHFYLCFHIKIIMESIMKDAMIISESKLEKLAKRVAKEFAISTEESFEIIYEEWGLVEKLFAKHKKAKAVKEHLLREINSLYRIA